MRHFKQYIRAMTFGLKYCFGFIVLLSGISLYEAILMNIEGIRKTDLTECLVGIIENLHRTVRRISLVTSSEDNTFLKDFLSRMRIPVVVNTLEQRKTPGIDTRMFSDIVVLYGDVNVSEILKGVLWHRDTRFLIVHPSETKMADNFWKFWEERVIQVFGVIEEAEGISLYSYQPYQEGDCNSTRPIRLDTWINGTFLGDGYSFVNENSRIKTGNGCPINLTTANAEPMVIIPKPKNCTDGMEVDGVEARYVVEFAMKLNFTLTVCFPKDGYSWGALYPSRGVLGEIYQRISDFGCGAFAQIPRRYGKVDFSRAYSSEECLTFVVPAGAGRDRLNWLKNLLGNLRPMHWILIVASFTSAAMFLCLFGSFPAMTSFMLILNSFLGRSIILPRVKTLKMVILFWIIFSSVISNIYQASLGREITLPLESSEIETFRQLLDSNLQFLGHPNALKMLNADDPVHKEIMSRFGSEELDGHEAMDRLLEKRDIALVRPVYLFMYRLMLDPGSRGKMGRLKECIRNYYPVMVLQKNSPFLRQFNNLIARIIESGIASYWRSSFFHNISVKRSSFTPVTIKRSLGIFVILMVGLAAAGIAFIGELGFNYSKRMIALRKFMKTKTDPQRQIG